MISQQNVTAYKAYIFCCEELQQQTKGHYENEMKIHPVSMYNAEILRIVLKAVCRSSRQYILYINPR